MRICLGIVMVCSTVVVAMRPSTSSRTPPTRRRAIAPARASAVALDDSTAELIANVLTTAPLAVPIGAYFYTRLSADRAKAQAEAAVRAEALRLKANVVEELESRAATLSARVGTLQSRLELSETELRRAKERLRVAEEKAKAEEKRVAEDLVRTEQRLSRAVLPDLPQSAQGRISVAGDRWRADSSPEADLVRKLGGADREVQLRRLGPGLQPNELVLVVGCPAPMAVLAVSALLEKLPGVMVRATVPSLNGTTDDSADVAVLRSLAGRRLQIVECDLLAPASLKAALVGVGAVVYCATSTGTFPSRATSPLGKILAGLVAATSGKFVEEEGVRLAAEQFARLVTVSPSLARGMTPKFVLLSTAGVSRADWSREKRRSLAELAVDSSALMAARQRGEAALRSSGLPYAIVRPVETRADAPRGRVVFSSGDLAAGEISRQDAVEVVAHVLSEQQATWKTFEVQSVPGLAPLPGRPALEFLPLDSDGTGFTTGYTVLQQLRTK